MVGIKGVRGIKDVKEIREFKEFRENLYPAATSYNPVVLKSPTFKIVYSF